MSRHFVIMERAEGIQIVVNVDKIVSAAPYGSSMTQVCLEGGVEFTVPLDFPKFIERLSNLGPGQPPIGTTLPDKRKPGETIEGDFVA